MRTNHWERVLKTIHDHGYCVVWEPGTEVKPAVAYTVGLPRRFARPDLVMLGLHADKAAGLAAQIVRRYRDGERFADQAVLRDSLSRRMALKDVGIIVAQCHAHYAIDYARSWGVEPSFQQLVVPDAEGRFPWDAGHRVSALQPALWSDRKDDVGRAAALA